MKARFGRFSEKQEMTNSIVEVMRKERYEANASDSPADQVFGVQKLIDPRQLPCTTEHRIESLVHS